MLASNNISNVFKTAKQLDFDNSSKLAIMGDCHRGDGNWYDNFSPNQNLYFHALNHYYKENYTYIDLGDSEELWENKNFSKIVNMNLDVFLLLKKFHEESRLYFIYGNHDIVKKDDKWLKNNYYQYFDNRLKKIVPLFPDIQTFSGIALNYANTNSQILLLHGHQVDFFNSVFWRFSRILVRHIWRPLELLGVHDPSHAAENYKKMHIVEKRLQRWAQKKNKILIAGHTHRVTFPDVNEIPYFNVGCAVYPHIITGIEIINGEIMLIKWSLKTRDDGSLFVSRDILDGPIKLFCYFNENLNKN